MYFNLCWMFVDICQRNQNSLSKRRIRSNLANEPRERLFCCLIPDVSVILAKFVELSFMTIHPTCAY